MAEPTAPTVTAPPPSEPGDADVPSLNEALGALQDELDRLRSASEHIERSKEAAREAVDAARHVGQAALGVTGSTKELSDRLGGLIDKLDKVDFPSRLDKLDATAGALQAGLQTIQGRLDTVERNVKDDVKGAQAAVSDRIHAVGEAVVAAKRELEASATQREEALSHQVRQVRLLVIGVLVGLLVVAGLAVAF